MNAILVLTRGPQYRLTLDSADLIGLRQHQHFLNAPQVVLMGVKLKATGPQEAAETSMVLEMP